LGDQQPELGSQVVTAALTCPVRPLRNVSEALIAERAARTVIPPTSRSCRWPPAGAKRAEAVTTVTHRSLQHVGSISNHLTRGGRYRRRMPVVPHLSETIFGLLWAGLVVLLVVVLARVLLRRRRRLHAADRDLTTSHHERGENVSAGR
ncbi:hypothetical protein, partial [Kineococcus arenarius]|uniref:hypothetical protein n=1 Tax=Kineococcus sp. SYSU DK007 TaxID=3383128 RepID=UPI003D7DF683